MKRGLTALVLLLVSAGVMADDMNDAFNTGSSYGKSNAGQGTGSLNNTDVIAGAVPGYTSSPSQSSSYGGVTGGDGGIADKGQQALSTDDAASAVISSGNTNPAVSIDPNAPYITNGKSAENNADSIADGTNSQCTTSTVSKSTFENYTCDHDVATVETCTRTDTPTGSWQTTETTKTVTIPNEQISFSNGGGRDTLFHFTPPSAGTILSASVKITMLKNMNSSPFTISVLGTSFSWHRTTISQNLPGAAGYVFTGGQTPNFTIHFDASCPSGMQQLCNNMGGSMAGYFSGGSWLRMDITYTVRTTTSVWTPSVTSSESCNFTKSAGTLISSQCTTAGGDKQVVQNGQTYTVHSDCWQTTDYYSVPVNSVGTCGSLINNSACTESAHVCTETTSGTCTHESETWQCQTVYSSSGLLCGGTYFCQTGDCSDTNGAGDSGFDTAVAKLAGLASAGDDVKNDQVNVKAFTGEAMSCRKAAAGFSNCCKDSGWGQDVGLNKCNSDEKALAAAKAKKITVSVGERCDHSVLGVCIQKSQVYCVFGGKLARIIQEQGRRDQLGIGFGSGDSPNCSGITVPQLQAINFDKINFSDFYQDLMDNQKIPNTDSMVAQVKQKIAAQVNQTTGGTTK
ncbi:type-F conjugative transfer system mating-pair stabilization protein TraN [Mangrovibacter phragmitis]|uniref:type-F conjugative transfer system mating-pair stabilization protein TraN n=1 Tax=Mangrovibacter phragmitis TaxID=1691903 RepID=UPI003514A45B